MMLSFPSKVRITWEVPVNVDRFEKLASGAQSIAVIAGLVISGVWAGYRFVLSPEAQHQAYLRRASTHPVPSIVLAVPCIVRTSDSWLVFADVKIQNASRSNLTFARKSPGSVVSASLIEYTPQGVMRLGSPVYGTEGFVPPDGENNATQVVDLKPIGAGQSATLRYVLRITAAGTYQLTFFSDKIVATDGPRRDRVVFERANMHVSNAFHLGANDSAEEVTRACPAG